MLLEHECLHVFILRFIDRENEEDDRNLRLYVKREDLQLEKGGGYVR